MAFRRSTTDVKTATPDGSRGEYREEVLDDVEPRLQSRRVMEHPSRMICEPFGHFRVLVGGMVVEESVDRLAGRNRAFDGGEGFDELLVSVFRHAAADDEAVEIVESANSGRSVAFVVVRRGSTPARL
jgi:hypothetical protein